MSGKLCEVKLLSREECETILNRALDSKNIELISFRVEYATDDNIGFLGEYFRLIAVAKIDNCPQTFQFFIKSLPIEEIQKQVLVDTGIFYKEVVLYEELLQDLSRCSTRKWKPDCYLSRADILVFEDLLVQGYFHIPKDREFTKDEVKIVLTALASFHAGSIAYELSTNQNIGKKFKDVLFETSIDENIEWFLTGARALRDVAMLHPKFQSPQNQDFLANQFMDRIKPIYDMVNPSKEFRNVLCHRDCWGGNVLFQKRETTISSVLLDFQICRYCPPAIDVMLCVYINTRIKRRQEILQECFESYYENLKEELAAMKINVDDHITWKEFLRSCEALQLMPLLYSALMYTLVLIPNNHLTHLKKNEPEKFDYFANVNRSALVLDVVQKDEAFRQEIFCAVEEVVNFLLDMEVG